LLADFLAVAVVVCCFLAAFFFVLVAEALAVFLSWAFSVVRASAGDFFLFVFFTFSVAMVVHSALSFVIVI
jgi:hypothetical protein